MWDSQAAYAIDKIIVSTDFEAEKAFVKVRKDGGCRIRDIEQRGYSSVSSLSFFVPPVSDLRSKTTRKRLGHD